MFKSQLRLGKLLGFPIAIDISWLLIFVLVTSSLAFSYFPQRHPDWSRALNVVMGVLTSVLFFVSVLLHELGHSLVARSFGTPVSKITLFIFGGVSEITEEPKTPKEELIMAAVGPLVSLALSAVFAILYLATRRVSEPLAALGLFLGGINLSLGLFNLIPGFPLDGGRVLRAILWGAGRDLTKATRWASWVGQGVAYIFIVIGIVRVFAGDWFNGIWIAFIGFFMDNAARSSYLQLTLRNLLEGHVVSEVMDHDCYLLPPTLTLDVAVDQYLLTSGKRCFTIGTPNGGVEGLFTIHKLRDIPKDQWPTRHISDVSTPLSEMRTVSPSTPLWKALQEMTTDGVNQLPVLVEGSLTGMLTRENLLTYIRNRSQLLDA
jgi:Zn-dependent protease